MCMLLPRLSLYFQRANHCFQNASIQINLPAETGDMGVLANHVPSIEQLKPGVVEVIEESGSKQFFCKLAHLARDSCWRFDIVL